MFTTAVLTALVHRGACSAMCACRIVERCTSLGMRLCKRIRAWRCSTVRHHVLQSYAAPCRTVLCSALWYYVMQRSVVLWCAAPCRIFSLHSRHRIAAPPVLCFGAWWGCVEDLAALTEQQQGCHTCAAKQQQKPLTAISPPPPPLP